MTGCQLFQCSPSTPENLCQVIDQLLVWGCLGQAFFFPVSESELVCVPCLEKNKTNKQSKSSLSPNRHTSSVNAINKSDAVSEKCLPERGNTHFKQQKVAVLESLGTSSLSISFSITSTSSACSFPDTIATTTLGGGFVVRDAFMPSHIWNIFPLFLC